MATRRRPISRRNAARARRRLCYESFAFFAQEAMREVPEALMLGNEVEWNWYLDAMAVHLEAWELELIRHLLINIKNKSLKSALASVLLPAWSWLRNPQRQWFTGGHRMDLAIEHCRRSREVIRSAWYQSLITDDQGQLAWTLVDTQDAKGFYINSKGGHRYAAWPPSGTGGQGNRFMIDDPLGIHDAESQVANDDANRWLGQTVVSRMNDPERDQICLVQHRLRRDDQSKHLLTIFGDELNGGEVTVLSLPLEYDPARARPTNKIGWADPRKDPGESLDPKRWTPQVIEGERRSQANLFEAISNQNPTSAGIKLIKRAWIKRWTHIPMDAVPVQSWDFSFKGLDPTVTSMARRKNRSKVCGITAFMNHQGCYFVDHTLDFMDYVQQKDALRDMYARNPKTVRGYVEDESNGSAILTEMKLEYRGLIGVNPTKKGGKYQRLAAVSGFFRAGNVYFPPDEAAPWVKPLIDTLCDYPQVDWDEEVDVVSQLLSEEWLPDPDLSTEDQLADELRRMIG